MRQNKLSQARLRSKLSTIQTPNILQMISVKQKKSVKVQQPSKKQPTSIKSTSRIIPTKILSKSIMHESDIQLKRPHTTKLRQKSIHITKKNVSVLIKNKTIDLSKSNESKVIINRRKSLVSASNSTNKIQSICISDKLGEKLMEKKILTDHIKELYLDPHNKNKVKANPKYGNFIVDPPATLKKKLNMDPVKTEESLLKNKRLESKIIKEIKQQSSISLSKQIKKNAEEKISTEHQFGSPLKKSTQSTPYLIKANSVQQGVNTSNTLLKMYLNPQTFNTKYPLLKKASKLVHTCNIIPQKPVKLSKNEFTKKFGDLTQTKLSKGFNSQQIYLIDFLPNQL